MTRPDIIVSALFNSDAVEADELFDTSGLDNLTLDFEDELNALGEPGPISDALDADPTSVRSNQITWGNSTNGATLTGSGLNQIESAEALQEALENGVASGAFDTLRILSGGEEILSLSFDSDAITLASGDQALSVRGTLPTEFQDIFDFVFNLSNVFNGVDLAAATNVLDDFDLEGLRLTDGNETLFDLVLDNDGLRINAGGGEFRVDGAIPADSIGTLIDLYHEITTLENSSGGLTNLDQLDDLEITSISLTDADGTDLIRTTGALNELDPAFENAIIQGAANNDVDVFVDGFSSSAENIIVRLEGGDDSVNLFGDEFIYGYIEGDVSVEGGAGFDTVSLTDFASQQVVADFSGGTLSGLTQDGVASYSVAITEVEGVEISTGQRAVVLGDDAANTAVVGDVFGQFEFYGGGATDVLDLTQIGRISTFTNGLSQSELSGFSVTYSGSNGLVLRHEDTFVDITLSDVEQVRVNADGRGDVLLTLAQVLEASGDADDLIVGTSEADSLSGDLGSDVLLGQSGGDYLYGDGIQANLTGDVAGQVFRMYQATLDRAPDATGYEGWVTGLFEGDLSLSQMATGFVRSGEFQNTYGSLDDSSFVNLLYQNVLGRDGDAGGVQGWLDAIANGTMREGVVLGFSESAEFKNTTATDAASFALSQSETHWTDDIYRVYRATLDRDPDAAGFEGWAELLGSGTEFDTMIGGFVNSLEFRNTYGQLDDAGFVDQLYQNVLDRAGDEGGVAGWLEFLDGGGTRAGVVQGFSQSAEFRNSTADDLDAWVDAQGVHDELNGGSGTNVLSGGLLQDSFVFTAGEESTSTVLDFEAWDKVFLRGFGYDDLATFRTHLTQQGEDAVFVDQDVSVTFIDTQTDQIELF